MSVHFAAYQDLVHQFLGEGALGLEGSAHVRDEAGQFGLGSRLPKGHPESIAIDGVAEGDVLRAEAAGAQTF